MVLENKKLIDNLEQKTIFVRMRLFSIYSMLVIILIALSCSPEGKSDVKKLQENDMNLHELTRFTFNEISYMHPGFMDLNEYSNHAISENSKSYISYNLDLEFCVEFFSESNVDIIKYTLEEEKNSLNAVHDNHVKIRENSLNEHSTSIKKTLPLKTGRNGFVQVIHGNTYNDGEDTSYFIATVEIDEQYYVFQLIGIRANMGYLHDDFINLISSIEI